jgi:dTDP-glucose pyrophosphorylase
VTADIYWKKCTLGPSASIRAAIGNLIESSARIVLVVSEDLTLLGTVSDGDIRRGLIKGLTLESPISKILHPDALTVKERTNLDQVRKLMTEARVQQIPIVSDDFKLVGLHEWDKLLAGSVQENLFVIMAGGQGRRLLPHTSRIPKPMVEIDGKPILEHIVLRARTNGFVRFVIVVYHLAEVIEKYFGNGEKLGVDIAYIKETQPLGTAGGLALLNPIPDSPIVVTNGDVLTEINYRNLLDFHVESGSGATMAVRVYETQHPFGVVRLKGIDITSIDEKPVVSDYINAGVYVIEPSLLNRIESGIPLRMTDFFDSLSQSEVTTKAYLVHENWIDIGNPGDLERANESRGKDL